VIIVPLFTIHKIAKGMYVCMCVCVSGLGGLSAALANCKSSKPAPFQLT
jgi:hypothetical protein